MSKKAKSFKSLASSQVGLFQWSGTGTQSKQPSTSHWFAEVEAAKKSGGFRHGWIQGLGLWRGQLPLSLSICFPCLGPLSQKVIKAEIPRWALTGLQTPC